MLGEEGGDRSGPRLELDDGYRSVAPTDRGFVEAVVATVLSYVGQSEREVSLRLTNDEEIARVHAEFLDDPTPTDVITFELDDTIDLLSLIHI